MNVFENNFFENNVIKSNVIKIKILNRTGVFEIYGRKIYEIN